MLIGIVASLFAAGGHQAHHLFDHIYALSPYWTLLITPFGLGLSVWLLRRYFSGALGGGIPQAIAALEPDSTVLRARVLSIKAVVGQIVLTLIGIASGATFGYEGPIVQVGAALSYSFNRGVAGRNERAARGIILAGAAAGVAAAFNAPLAGIVFAIEEMSHAFNYERRSSSTILLCVIVAGLTSLSIQGSYNYFGITSVILDWRQGWSAILVCGIVGGLSGSVSSKLMRTISHHLPKPLQRIRGNFPVLFAMMCGLALALIGIGSHGITLGTGYYRARDIILQTRSDLGAFGILKWCSMMISFASGAPGGMLVPSLAVGAGIGLNVATLLPAVSQTAVVLLGMVAFFSGMTLAPMTGFVIVMEMSDSSSMIIPLMAAALIASNLSRLISRRALYPTLAHQFHRKMQHATAAPHKD